MKAPVKEKLTFGKIAELEARQDEGHDQALDAAATLYIYFGAYLRGEFAPDAVMHWRQGFADLKGEEPCWIEAHDDPIDRFRLSRSMPPIIIRVHDGSLQEISLRKQKPEDIDALLSHVAKFPPEISNRRWWKWYDVWAPRLTISRRDFLRWQEEHGHEPLAYWSDAGVPQEGHIGEASALAKGRGLTNDDCREGGKRRKYNRALQEAINRVHQKVGGDRKTLTLSALKNWFDTNSSDDEPYSFEPPIPDCDDLYIDGQKLVWTNRRGRESDLTLRSVERYVRRANELTAA